MLALGRSITRDLAAGERREWLCTNGIGGFASGTVAGTLTRRYHGLLMAALAPPLGRTLLVAKADEQVTYDGRTLPLSTNRWGDGSVAPAGYGAIERFRLAGTTPVWTYAVADALLEKRVFMEHGANTTYVQYTLVRGGGVVDLEVRVLVNYRDYHALTRGGDWRMDVTRLEHGVRVDAFEGARPVLLLMPAASIRPEHVWYRDFRLSREDERGLDAREDHLHAVTFGVRLDPGQSVTLVTSSEGAPDVDGAAAWRRRQRHETAVLEAWERTEPANRQAPAWVGQLVLAADQFVVKRPTADDPEGLTIIAGYPWFADWGRDTMISLPGLTLATGRADVARRILVTFARWVDGGMLPNRFPDQGETPEYNTVDAALWYIEAVRAYCVTTKDADTLAALFPALEQIIGAYRAGTRYGIAEDPADGLLRAGEPGVQLTWMDAKIGDWVVTPRTGKAVEVNALWYNALCAMRTLARQLGRPTGPWHELAERVRGGFGRFWNEATGHCDDVIDGPDGRDVSLRPNQILAVALPARPLAPDRERRVVEACARHLLTPFGLRSLAPGDARYAGRYEGGPGERDAVYHQGAAWGWLLGPFAIAHLRVHGDPEAARALLEPVADHLGDDGLGSIAEIFDGDPPHHPRGCPAQAWSVAGTLQAWTEVTRASVDGAAVSVPSEAAME